jgi:exopolysaccharide production protein ExoZ
MRDLYNRFAETFLLRSKYPALDGLRALAIILVFNIHFFGEFGKHSYFLGADSFGEVFLTTLRAAGHLGVDLFFVLSGFLIFRSLLKSNPTPGTFIRKRVARLLPAHLFVLIVIAAKAFVLNSFILNLFLLPGLFKNMHNYNFVTWSLSWEMLFYLIIFLFFILYKRINYRYFFGLLLGLCVSLLLAFTFLENNDTPLMPPNWGRFMGFFMGVAIAYWESKDFIYIKNRTWLLRIGTYIAIILIAYCSWAFYKGLIPTTSMGFSIFYITVAASFSVIVLRMILAQGILNRIVEFPLFRFLGQISYSFYLCHILVIEIVLFTVLPAATSFKEILLYYVIVFTSATIMAAFMYYYFERPYFLNKK